MFQDLDGSFLMKVSLKDAHLQPSCAWRRLWSTSDSAL